MATGSAVVDFGAYPGSPYATVVITGQSGILTGSLVECWIFPAATTDHTHDEHIVDPPRVVAGNVVAGTGFTIHALAYTTPQLWDVLDGVGAPQGSRAVTHWGKWNVAWVWQP